MKDQQQALMAVPVKEAALTAPTPISIYQLAIERGASVEILTQLLSLHREVEADEARKAFNEAFAAAKAEFPRIEKTKLVSFGQTTYKFAPLDKITEAVNPVLSKHGLSYSWKQEKGSQPGYIQVTCFLRHVRGQFDTNTLEGPPDKSGSKNELQAIKSSTSYLRRGTLEGVLGIATADEDTDGMTMGNAVDFVASIQGAGDVHELEQCYKQAVKSAREAKDYKAVGIFLQARDKRQKELNAA